ncbi:MAG TPA: EamA family transporter [Candidatus Baltobacteraceae bacterium]|jgi:drug/metabolite transporter (DMT)-like permease|nr:EamA family transporter [Candidatus Baltobacteraceae bacterium]
MSGRRYLPWIALIAIWFLWGSTYLAIRVGVETIPPYLMIGTRYMIAGVLLFALQWAFAPRDRKPPLPTLKQALHIAITGALLLTIGNGLLSVSETRVDTSIAALLVASTPIWMLVLEAIRVRKPIGMTSIAGLIVGTLGIGLLVGQPSGQADVLYTVLLLVSAFSWALGSVYARATEHHPLAAPVEMFIGGALAVVVGLCLGEGSHFELARVSLQSWLGMLWLITGGAMAGYTAFAFAVRTLPAATVSTYCYVNPVVAVLLGVTFLHEPMTRNVAAGGAAVIASVVVILLGNRDSYGSEIVESETSGATSG